MKTKTTTFGICLIGVLIALGIVLSAMLPIKVIGDIKIDLSYIVIVVICYLFGGIIGGLSAALIALLESMIFSSYGISISWICANLVIGLGSGLVMQFGKANKTGWKIAMDLSAIILSCAVGLLLLKTVIECKLYSIPWEVKIVKNAVAFGMDTACMVIGYLFFLPKILAKSKVENKLLKEA